MNWCSNEKINDSIIYTRQHLQQIYHCSTSVFFITTICMIQYYHNIIKEDLILFQQLNDKFTMFIYSCGILFSVILKEHTHTARLKLFG